MSSYLDPPVSDESAAVPYLLLDKSELYFEEYPSDVKDRLLLYDDSRASVEECH